MFMDHVKLSQRFLEDLIACKYDPDLYAPDACLWHNTDEEAKPVSTLPDRMAPTLQAIPDFRLSEVRASGHADGCSLQFRVEGTGPGGTQINYPAAMFITISDGRITWVEEYLDSAAAQPLIDALGGSVPRSPRT